MGTAGVLVGPAGWSYPDWEGIVYPRPKPRGFQPLAFIAGMFDLVEVNMSFYRIPEARHVERWVDLVAHRPSFRFLFKMWRGFTHDYRREKPTMADVNAFKEGVAPAAAADRLAGFLVQFPYSWTASPANLEHVAKFADRFGDVPLFLEVRHRSWLDRLDRVAELGMGFVNIDQPVGNKGVPPTDIALGAASYVRLHGRNEKAWFARGAGRDDKYDYLYGQGELDEWVERIERLRAKSETVYLVTNNHYRGQAVVNALQLQDLLGVGEGVVAPPQLEAVYPQLAAPSGDRDDAPDANADNHANDRGDAPVEKS